MYQLCALHLIVPLHQFLPVPLHLDHRGIVADVMVEVGDNVSEGDVLLELDPLSAPQNVIMAQADLISARQDLAELLNPTDLQISNAQKSVADAEEDLDDLLNPDIEALKDALRDAEFDLARAEQDVELADIGTATSALENALDTLEDMKERQVSVQKLENKLDTLMSSNQLWDHGDDWLAVSMTETQLKQYLNIAMF